MEEKDFEKLVQETLVETEKMMTCAQMLMDSGAYKKRVLYKISDAEWSTSIQQIRNILVSLLVTVSCTNEMLKGDEKKIAEHKELQEKVMARMIEIKKSEIEKEALINERTN
jgi:hypothetical protein